MSPYQIFRICQGAIGRRYRGTIDDFKLLDCCSYYYSLSDYLDDKVGRDSKKQRKFIQVCEVHYGSRFDPFHLMTDEYMKVYLEWESVNGSDDAYKQHVLKSIQDVYDFCRERDITRLKDYTERWAISHITSGVLDENVAYALKVQDARLSKPEKRIIKKKFLDKLKDIEDRFSRDNELREFIQRNLDTIEKKISES